jgi:hypothetical protein
MMDLKTLQEKIRHLFEPKAYQGKCLDLNQEERISPEAWNQAQNTLEKLFRVKNATSI